MNIPSSTYRVQLHKGFTFADLRHILDYLQELGVSTIYAAPILKSRRNSMHGYDVVDPHVIDPEIGTIDELREIAAELKAKNMTWLQDIVPNHMAYDTQNHRLMDVLERGPGSPYYNYFDIDWNHPSKDLKGKLMVPFLGKELAQCLDEGDVTLGYGVDGFFIACYDTRYPLSTSAYDKVADQLLQLMELSNGPDLSSWRQQKREWFSHNMTNAETSLICEQINKDKSRLKDILATQFYTLTFWKRTETEINYRRFFTVNELICLKMEDKHVFDEYHKLIKELYDENLIQGIRIDHIDGLQDPLTYLRWLRDLLGDDCYIIAEKILEAKESIPADWPIQGTSGYEFLSFVNQLVTDRQGARKLLNFYHELVPDLPPYEKLVVENKRRILRQYMRGEWDNLTHQFYSQHLGNGFDRESLKNALAAVMVSMPVYRIYPDHLPLEGDEKKAMDEAFQRAVDQANHAEEQVKYLQRLFVYGEEKERRDILAFEKRLMQFTGPLTAKGVEDTTFYVYNPLVSHDEVGDAPSILGITIDAFHGKMIQRLKNNPASLNATATHDTKRGEDARLRLNVLSEMPDIWIRWIREWMTSNAPRKLSLDENLLAPSTNDEYFIYQTLVASFPHDLHMTNEFIQRLEAFMTKAMREAKQFSDWSDPNKAYENASLTFASAMLRDETYTAAFIPLIGIVTKYATRYSLAQVLVKITAPGIPDIYQGCELWDLSFVDPDNRRPVDYAMRADILKQLKNAEQEGLTSLLGLLKSKRSDGYEKFFATYKALNLRRRYAPLFLDGEYIPLKTTGRDQVVLAFARRVGRQWALTVIPLALAKNTQIDQPYADDAHSPSYVVLPDDAPQYWKNVFTNERLTAAGRLYLFEAFKDFPVALLVSDEF